MRKLFAGTMVAILAVGLSGCATMEMIQADLNTLLEMPTEAGEASAENAPAARTSLQTPVVDLESIADLTVVVDSVPAQEVGTVRVRLDTVYVEHLAESLEHAWKDQTVTLFNREGKHTTATVKETVFVPGNPNTCSSDAVNRIRYFLTDMGEDPGVRYFPSDMAAVPGRARIRSTSATEAEALQESLAPYASAERDTIKAELAGKRFGEGLIQQIDARAAPPKVWGVEGPGDVRYVAIITVDDNQSDYYWPTRVVYLLDEEGTPLSRGVAEAYPTAAADVDGDGVDEMLTNAMIIRIRSETEIEVPVPTEKITTYMC